MRIVHLDEAGRTVVTGLAPGVPLDRALRRLGLRDVPHVLVSDEAAPPTVMGIGAWRLDGKRVVLDMAAARAAHMDMIRHARDEELRALDIAWNRATDAGDHALARRIGQQRQKLRDLPQTFNMNNARSPAELREMWPEALADRRPARPDGARSGAGGGAGSGTGGGR